MAPAAPPPIAPSDLLRVEHQRLVWRILYHQHRADVEKRVRLSVGNIRRDAWGPLDLTSNPLLSVWSQAAATYRSEPTVDGPAEVVDAVAEAGHWARMQRVQRDALALREMLVRIDYDEDEGISLRPVPPFLVEVVANPRHPSRALQVAEWTPDPDDGDRWVKIVCNARKRIYEALDEDGNDVSVRILGGSYSGDAYPYLDHDGTPILPWVVYRPELTGSFWDWSTGSEMVEAVLNLGVHYTHYGHLLKDCSWLQRYMLGATVAGESDTGTGEASHVVTDASSLLLLQPASEYVGQVLVGQWGAAADPEVYLRSVQSYERRIVDNALGTANVSRASSDIRSGFSLAVSKEDQRELQRSYEPTFRRADLDLLRICGALMGVPGDFQIQYKAIPKDPREVAADLERISKAIELGLMTLVQGYMELHPGLTLREAEEALAEIERINSDAGNVATPPPPEPTNAP